MKALLRHTLGAALLAAGLLSGQAHALTSTGYDRVFDRADLDHDGFLSYDEYAATQPAGSRQVDIMWRFQYNDVNQDGFLDKLEYRASRGGKDGGRPSKTNTFLTADLDHDGFLDPSEFALTQPQSWPMRKVLILFARRDLDGDSLISPREFGGVNIK